MARVKDLWFSEVPVKDADAKVVRDRNGRTVIEKRKTGRHPDRGGNKNAKRWLAVWIDPDGNEKTRAFAKQDQAKKYGDRMEADVDRGEYVDPNAGTEKVGPLAGKYLRLRAVGGTTRAKHLSVYKNQVEPVFAHRTVRAVRPSEILEWLRSPEMTKLSPSTRKHALAIMRGTFDLAVADRMRRDNPARSDIIEPPHDEPSQREPWNAATVWLVHDEIPQPYRAIVTISAGLGLRQGEALALAESDFDFDTMKVTIRRQIALVHGMFVFKLPKEGKVRVIPMSRGVAAEARAYFAEHPPRPYELPWMDEDGALADEPHTCLLIFRWHGNDRRTRGKHIKASSFNDRVWKPALGRAGIISPPDGGEFTSRWYSGSSDGNGTHQVRHFFSVTLQDGGVSLAGVMDFMGHSRKGLPVTLAVYGHVTEDTFEQARAAIDRVLFKLRPVASAGTVTELRAAQ